MLAVADARLSSYRSGSEEPSPGGLRRTHQTRSAVAARTLVMMGIGLGLGYANLAAQDDGPAGKATALEDGESPVARWNAERWQEWDLERARWEQAWREFAWRHPDRVPEGLERLVPGLPPPTLQGRRARPLADAVRRAPSDRAAGARADRLRSAQRWYRSALERLRRLRADRLGSEGRARPPVPR